MRAALVAALPTLVVYLRTVSPTISGWDAGDLSTASYTLGIAHPPGYPFYTLFGRVFALLVPIGDVGFRFSLLSALSGTVAIGLTAAVARIVCGALLPSCIAAWTLAFSMSFWSQCVVTEVYALNCAIFALVWLLLLRWGEYGSTRSLFLAALLYGIGLAHHLSLSMSAPAIAAYVLWRRTSAPFRWRWVPLLGAFLLLGPCLYFYLIIRAQQNPVYNFDRPDSWDRFIFHVRAQTYYFRLVELSSAIWVRRFLSVGRVIVQEIGWPGAVGAAAGVALSVRRHAVFALVPVLVTLFYAGYTAAYRIPDIRVYYLPVLVILAIPLACALAAAARLIPRPVGPVLVVVLASLLPGSLLIRNWGENDYHSSRLVREWVEGLHNMATDGGRRPATLFILGDTDLFTSAYLQMVEGHHPALEIRDLAGNIYADTYRLWEKGKVGTTIPDEHRWRSEEAVVRASSAQGKRSYFIPHPDYTLAGHMWAQRAVLFEALPLDAPRDTSDVWRYLPDIRPYEARRTIDRESRMTLCNVHLLRGVEALEANDDSLALAHWERADRLAGDLIDIHMSLSRFYLTIGKKDRAIAHAKRVIDLDPDEGNSYSNYADVLIAMKDTTEAVRLYEQALSTGGYLLGAQFIRLANIYRLRGNGDKAVLYYRHALSVQPSDANGWAALASAYVRAQDLDRAVYCNRRAIELNPQFAEAFGNLGFVYLNQSRYEEAERALLEAQRIRPGDPRTLMNLGIVYVETKRVAPAVETFRELVRVAPGFPDAHYQLGSLAAAQGDIAGAARELRAEVDAYPANTKALGELGVILSQLGRPAEAASLWERVLQIAPNDPRAHFNLAVYYSNAGQRPQAIAHYRQFLVLVPSGEPADRARDAIRSLGG